mgnify:CR=1 FL=1
MKINLGRFLSILFLQLMFCKSLFALDLLQAYEFSKRNDHKILEAEANHNAIMQSYPIARSALLPNFEFNASSERTRESVDGSVYGSSGSLSQYTTDKYSIDLTQPIYRRDLYTLLEKSKDEVSESLAKRDSARQDLIIRVTEAYFNVLIARDNLEYAESERNAIKLQLEEANEKFKIGLYSIREVTDVQASFDLVQTKVIENKNDYRLSKENLSTLTGSYNDVFSSLSELYEPKISSLHNLDSIEDSALSYNLDLIAQKRKLDASSKNLKYQRSKHYPTLDLYASVSKIEKGGGSSGAYESNNDYIGIKLNVPIFTGGQTYYNSKKAAYEHEAARQQYSLKKKNIVNEARRAFLNLENSVKHVSALKKALESRKLSVEYNRVGEEVGNRSILDTLFSIKEMYEAKANFSKAKYLHIINQLKLKKVTGALSAKDIELVNNWLD